MGYENGKIYWIVPQNNTGIALSVYGNTQVSQNRNVIVWSKQDVLDQLWRVDIDNGFARIKSAINYDYALNIWLGSSNYGNCDIHTWSDNKNDSKINFKTIDASRNLYLIQCYRNDADNNLYLTAESTASGANVKWAARNTGANQVWQLIEKTNAGGNTGTGGGLGPYGKYVYPTYCKKLSDDFRLKATDTERQHLGIDIRDKHADHGVYAFADGVVSFVQDANHPDSGTNMWTMGNCIAINHSNPTTNMSGQYARTLYMHLLSAPTLTPGQQVKKGDHIGTIGNTGKSTGPHLHFGLFVGNDARMAPGVKGWTSISLLPVVDPINALPFYHVDRS